MAFIKTTRSGLNIGVVFLIFGWLLGFSMPIFKFLSAWIKLGTLSCCLVNSSCRLTIASIRCLHLLIRSLFLDSETHRLELVSVRLWLSPALGNIRVTLCSQLGLLSSFFLLLDGLLVSAGVLDLSIILLHLYHYALGALDLISVEN